MKLVAIISAVIVAVIALFALFNYMTARRHARFTRSDVIHALRNVLDLDESAFDHDEWDLFLSWPIDDPYLDSIRQRCNDISKRERGMEPGTDLSKAGRHEVQRILTELEDFEAYRGRN